MKREISIYLDLVRFLSALIVFIGHLSGQRLTGGFLWEFGGLMDAAVVVFFVLSGYVIAYTTDKRERTARAYSTSRLARIYSVALPAVLLALVLDGLGKIANPAIYQPSWGYVGTDPLLRAASLLTFTNELWNAHVTLGSLLPYWSLGYEIWYYVLFGVAYFLRSWIRILAIVLVALIIGPKIMLLFPIWIFGALAYAFGKSEVVSPGAGWGFLIISVAGGILFTLAMRGSFGPQFVLAHTGVAARYVEGLIFTLNIVGFQATAGSFSTALKLLAKPVHYLAGMTFSLYLVHLPLAQFIAAMSPFRPQSGVERVLIFGGTFVMIILFSHATERQKRLWRNWFEKLGNGASALVRRPVILRNSA